MKVAFYLNCVSPHQLPLAREVARRVGENNFYYIYVEPFLVDRVKLGWGTRVLPSWCVPLEGHEVLLENADVVYCGIRDIDLFERRATKGKKTFYYSERWFKPLKVVRLFGLFNCSVPGWIRMFVPAYFRMARRFVRWLNGDLNARYFAVGPWAAKDMHRLGVKSEKIVSWGYFVEPSAVEDKPRSVPNDGMLRLLWVGRMLKLKRVGDIIRAVKFCIKSGRKVVLDLYGSGPEENRLKKLTDRFALSENVRFFPSVQIAEVRKLMREHDIYVFSSNAMEGWGAVVSEALEEEMKVVGTYEAGSCAAILPESNLYHSGDWKRLAKILCGKIAHVTIGEWSAKCAAERMIASCEE